MVFLPGICLYIGCPTKLFVRFLRMNAFLKNFNRQSSVTNKFPEYQFANAKKYLKIQSKISGISHDPQEVFKIKPAKF